LLPERLPRAIVRLAGKHPRPTLLIAMVVLALAVVIGSRIRIEADFLRLIPEDNPVVSVFTDTIERFGSTDILLLAVVVDEEALDAYQLYADEMVDGLRDSERIDWVEYRLSDLEEAAESLMDRFTLFMRPEDLERLLVRMNPAGAEAEAARLADSVRRNLDLAAKELLTRDPLNVAPVLMESSRWQGVNNRFQNSGHQGYIIDEDESLVLIFAKPTGAAADIPFAKALLDEIAAIREAADLVWQDEGFASATPDLLVAGGYPIAAAEARLIQQDLVWGVGISLLGVIILFTVAFGRPVAILVSAFPLVVGLACATAFGALTLGSLNAATSAFAALLTGLAVDFIIVLYGRFLEERSKGRSVAEALASCGQHTSLGVLLGAVTTAATFFAFLVSGFRGLSELGILTGGGILVMVLVVFFLLPALLAMLETGRPTHAYRMNAFGIDRLTYWGANNPRMALMIGFFVTLLTAIPATKIEYDDNVLNMRSPKNPGMVDQNRIVEAFGMRFTPYMIRIDAPDENEAIKRAVALAESLRPLRESGELARVETALSFLPTREEQQLIIDRLAEFSYDREAFRETFIEALDREGMAFSPFEAGLENVFDALEVRAPITPATLSETSLGHFLNRFLTETETGAAAVVHAYPAPDRLLSDLPPGLQAVMDANPDARLAGPIAVTNELKVIVKRDAFIALTIGTIIVFLMLALELGGWRHGLLALIPLIAGVIWMLGTMSMLGLPTNYMNIFVFTMIVGIGVDYGIHLIHRLNETNRVEALAATSRTIVVAALTTVLGFGSLITSHYPGLRSMGITAILGAVYTALAAIVLLPALASIPESQKKR